MYDNFEIISKNIKYLREKKGYTQEQLAEAADLSVSHISKVESGQRRIGMKAYLTVLEALNVNEEDFIVLVSILASYCVKIELIKNPIFDSWKKKKWLFP